MACVGCLVKSTISLVSIMIKKVLLLIGMFIVLNGCGIGGMWMNGNPFFGEEPYIPLRDYWVAGDFVPEQRNRDWIECEGHRINSPIPRLNAKEWNEVTNAMHLDVQRCMLKKGYHYTGQCIKSNANWPACGAP